MLIAGAVCPHPPVLIPDALGSAGDDPPARLRKVAEAAARAVAGLLAAGPDLIVVVGGGDVKHEYGADASGGLHAFGVDVTVGTGEPVLPLSLTVGRWLLERAGLLGLAAVTGAGAAGMAAGMAGVPAAPTGRAAPGPHAAAPAAPVVFCEVARHTAPSDCLKLGRALAGRAPRVALLAMGDSCARPARDAPGVPDPAAQEYDAGVAQALAAGDTRWLARLDPALDAELVVAGRAAWQVLAGAAAGARMHGRLLSMSAPYEVTYLVAVWEQSRVG
jgi:hypothetical protein